MIRKTEKYYTKRIRKYKGVNRTYDEYGTQYIKKTTYWLLLVANVYELIQNLQYQYFFCILTKDRAIL